MTAEDFTRCLRSLSRRMPFREFVVEFVNGKQIAIRHPDAIASYGDIWIFRSPAGNRVLFSSSSVCRLLDGREPSQASP